MTVLWTSNVGSHLWKMEHPNSDIDLFQGTIANTRDILRGRTPKNNFMQLENGIDIQIQEIGHVTEQIISGNFNYIGYVFSPIVIQADYQFLDEYRKRARRVLSRQVYHSIRGMAESNLKKYKEANDKWNLHRWHKIGRVLQFGRILMNTGTIAFNSYNGGEQDMVRMLKGLEDAYRNGTGLELTPREEYVDALWEFVVDERIRRIEK